VICLSDKIEDKSLEALIKLGLRTRFPDECTAWERRRKEVMQGFRETTTERQAEMPVKLEQSFKDIRVKLEEAVVAEVLKVFPWVLSTPRSLCVSSFMAAPIDYRSVRRESILPNSSSAESAEPGVDANDLTSIACLPSIAPPCLHVI